MNRDAYTFLSGSAAALAYAHAAYALAASRGIMNEPILFGRTWGVEFAWAEVVIYSAVSAALASRRSNHNAAYLLEICHRTR